MSVLKPSETLSALTDQAATVTDRAATAADQALKSTQRLAHDAIDAVRDTTQQLREHARHAQDSTANYIKHDPIKSVLIAAATGAALMALVSLLGRSRDRN